MCSTGDVRSLRARNVTGEPLGDHVDVFDVLVAGDDECRNARRRRAAARPGDRAEPPAGRHDPPTARRHDVASRRPAREPLDRSRPGCGGDPRPRSRRSGLRHVRRRRARERFPLPRRRPQPVPTTRGRRCRSRRARAPTRVRAHRAANSSAALPPSEVPTTAACATPAASSASAMAPLYETGFVSISECPNPGRSTRMTVCDSEEGVELRLPHPRVRDACVHEHDGRPFAVDVVPDAHSSSTNRGLMNSANVWRSQLASVTGVSARTDAVRGMCIASATSPK